MPDGKFGHFSGANDQDPLVFQLAQDLFREFHRGKADRYGLVGDLGFRPDPFGHGKGTVEQFVQNQPRGFAVRRPAIGFLQLTEDLGFPQNHGIQAGGDPEQMPHRFSALIGIKIRRQFLGTHPAHLRHQGPQIRLLGLPSLPRRHDFQTIAGREDDPLPDSGNTAQAIENLGHAVFGEAELFADLDRSGFMAQSD